jgi:hypothetical protein
MISKEKVLEMARSFPIPLLDLKDQELIKYANNILPYSTGIEVEAPLKISPYDLLKEWSNIHDIANSNIPFIIKPSESERENTDYEFQFRIPSGIKGLICLYWCCEFMKEYGMLNPISGNHYHIDFTEFRNFPVFYDIPEGYFSLNHSKRNIVDTEEARNNELSEKFIAKNSNWVLKELGSWNYSGNFNRKKMGFSKSFNRYNWVQWRSSYKTLEFRTGEMSFGYSLIVKRISHAQRISYKLKQNMVQFAKLNNISL